MKLFSDRFFFLVGGVLLSITHYLAAVYFPTTDKNETFIFSEPIHFLLYGTGKQAWPNCKTYSYGNWAFILTYTLPALFRYRMIPIFLCKLSSMAEHDWLSFFTFLPDYYPTTPRPMDAYIFSRIVYGQVACAAELFFVFSLRSACGTSKYIALVALGLLATSSAIPRAAVSILPSSFSMICYFAFLGCCLRCCAAIYTPRDPEEAEAPTVPRHTTPIFSRRMLSFCAPSIFAGLAVILTFFVLCIGWPFAALLAIPMLTIIFFRFTHVSCLVALEALLLIPALVILLDRFFYCHGIYTVQHVLKYYVFSEGALYLKDKVSLLALGKLLITSFDVTFILVVISPFAVLYRRGKLSLPTRREMMKGETEEGDLGSQPAPSYPIRVMECLCVSTLFAWLVLFSFWKFKVELCPAPAYPFLIFAASISVSWLIEPIAVDDTEPSKPSRAAGASKATLSGFELGWKHASYKLGQRKNNSDQPSSDSTKAPTPAEFRTCLSSWGKGSFLVVLLVLCFGFSVSRSLAVYHFYSGPQRVLVDQFENLVEASEKKWRSGLVSSSKSDGADDRGGGFHICVGALMEPLPSSFFFPHNFPAPFPNLRNEEKLFPSMYSYYSLEYSAYPYTTYRFIRKERINWGIPLDFFRHAPPVTGLLNFTTFSPSYSSLSTWKDYFPDIITVPRACLCASPLLNNQYLPVPHQYVNSPAKDCDAVLDAIAADDVEMNELEVNPSMRKKVTDYLSFFPHDFLQNVENDHYRLIDESRTPKLCRLFYLPFGISNLCVHWKQVVLRGKS